MGYSRWTKDDFTTYASATSYQTKSRDEVFTSRGMPPELDPAKITLRESVDSAKNPNSTPIIFGLDVTGSMGQYAEIIAKEALPELMSSIIEASPVQDPHLMFMGIDDVHTPRGCALQVSQFEADISILEQLRKIYLVGGGGGNRSESYDLPWVFASTCTKIDCFDKRGKKGYLFTIGDEEAPYETISEAELKQVFGPGQYQAIQPSEALAAAKEKYNVFHIVIEQGQHFGRYPTEVRSSWSNLLGSNVLFLRDVADLTDLVLATLKISEGADIEEVIRNSSKSAMLRHAFVNALG